MFISNIQPDAVFNYYKNNTFINKTTFHIKFETFTFIIGSYKHYVTIDT